MAQDICYLFICNNNEGKGKYPTQNPLVKPRENIRDALYPVMIHSI